MKSSTATSIIVVLAVVNIAGLTLFAEQIQSYLGASLGGLEAVPNFVKEGYPEDVADVEQLLEREKASQETVSQPISEVIGSKQCRRLLSDCRIACHKLLDQGTRVDDIDSCFADCEQSFQFCGQ